MPKRNRQTLKEGFKNGNRPTQQDFENLIDSTMNILDDGFSKSPESGMGLAPLLGEGVVMSIYREPADVDPLWEVSVDPDNGSLKIGRFNKNGAEPLIILTREGNISLGAAEKDIVFSGTLNTPGRKGTFLTGKVPANGKWQDITSNLEGCWALEVVAGCGKRNAGKHALLVATAIHCFGSHAKVKKVRSHYGTFGNRLCLRWIKTGFSCRLQVKTVFNYGDGVMIRYHISKLWDNPLMDKDI